MTNYSVNFQNGSYEFGNNTDTLTLYDSGGSTGDYESSENFEYTVIASSENNHLVITGQPEDLEINYDFLKMYDGDSDSATEIFNSQTQNLSNTPIKTTQNKLFIKFTSDSIGNNSGFEINIKSQSSPSNEIIQMKDDFVTSINNGNNPRDFVSTDDNITVSFNPSEPKSQMIYSQTYQVTATFSDSNSTINHSFNETVQQADNVGDYIAFNLNTLSTNQSLKLTSEQIFLLYDSGGPNNKYDNNENLNFTFEASEEYRHISIYGEEENLDTNYDFLKIYDGNSDTATEIFNSKTQNLSNTPIKTTQNKLFIKFTSDSVLNKPGFKLYIRDTQPSAPAPTCFPKGTPVLTNLGPVAIEKLNTDKHTIRGKEIVAITQSRPLQKHIVCFEKDSLNKNVPSQETLCSMEHKVFYKGEMIKARDIVDVCENVTLVDYNGETLFNVLLKKHDKMMINNLICETLHPKNIMAKISQMKNGQKKNKAIQELTKIIKENNIPEYQKLYASL